MAEVKSTRRESEGRESERETSRRASQACTRVVGSVGDEPKRLVRDVAQARIVAGEAELRRRWRKWRRESVGEGGARESAVVRFVVKKTVCRCDLDESNISGRR